MQILYHAYALQRINTENAKQIFPEKDLRGHSPSFNIHVSVSDDRSAYSAAGTMWSVDRSWEYINRSQTYERGN